MFGPDNKIFGNFYPAMLEQAVEVETIRNQFFWSKLNHQNDLFNSSAIANYNQLTLDHQIRLAALKFQILKLKTKFRLMQVKFSLQLASKDLQIGYYKTLSHPVVSEIRSNGPEIATFAGVGTALRMAIATADQADLGDMKKAAIAAGIGVACITAPAIAAYAIGRRPNSRSKIR